MPLGRSQRWLAYGCLALIVLLGGGGLWLSKEWPFTQEAVTRTLQQRFARTVKIGRFRKTWFPPGCVAGDVSVAPYLSAHDLIIQSSWTGLLRRHVGKIKVVGLRITISPAMENMVNEGGKSSFSGVGEVEANNAVLVFLPRTAAGKPNVIQLHQLIVDHVGAGKAISFRAALKTDKPAGDVLAQGTFGPWNDASPGATPIAGVYQFANANLNAFHGLNGILSAQGRFNGNLSNLDTRGTVAVPNLLVDGSAHSVDLTARFAASVDAHTADTILNNVDAHVGHTFITGKGNVSGGEGTEGKTARLEMTIDTGRVEDLLNYFSEEKRASMTGAVRLRAYVELPPGPGFLKKVRVTGDFGVAAAKFTSPARQIPVNHLGESALGEKKAQQEEDPRTLLSNLKGHVVARDGVAHLSGVSFEFPGSLAEMNGIYNLIPRTVDIHGSLRTDGTLSDAGTGVKALMLKVATPFLKKKQTTIVPFVITGPSSNPTVGLDLQHKVKM